MNQFNDTGGKFAPGVVDTGGKSVSLIPVANLPTGINNTSHLDLRISLRVFEKNSKLS
jgi:hypothetical protein